MLSTITESVVFFHLPPSRILRTAWCVYIWPRLPLHVPFTEYFRRTPHQTSHWRSSSPRYKHTLFNRRTLDLIETSRATPRQSMVRKLFQARVLNLDTLFRKCVRKTDGKSKSLNNEVLMAHTPTHTSTAHRRTGHCRGGI